MILYKGTIENFNQDVVGNCIADKVSNNYIAYYHRRPSRAEYRAFAYSLAILNNSFQYAGLRDNYIIVEYELPYSSKRIDVLLFGSLFDLFPGLVWVIFFHTRHFFDRVFTKVFLVYRAFLVNNESHDAGCTVFRGP